MKIRHKILIFILSIMLILSTLLIVDLFLVSRLQINVSNQMIEKMTEDVEDLVVDESTDMYANLGESIGEKEFELIERSIDYIYGRMALEAEVMQKQFRAGDDEEDVLNCARDAWAEYTKLANININTFIATSSGRVINLAGIRPETTEAALAEDYVIASKLARGENVNSVITDNNGEYYLSMAVSYSDANGKTAGALVSRVPFKLFSSSLSKSVVGEHGRAVVIIDDDSYAPASEFLPESVATDEWKSLIDEVIDNRDGATWVTLPEDRYYVIYRSFTHTDWKLCIFISKMDMDKQSVEIKEAIAETADDMHNTVDRISSVLIRAIIILVIILGLVAVCVTYLFAQMFVRPLDKLIAGVKKIESGDLDAKVEANTSDEIGELADAYNDMTMALKHQMEEIKSMTAAEEKSKAEMAFAADMQRGMLPADRISDENVEASGYYRSAKALGGDFYDYFYIDDSHVAIIIADVSDKGIPAALFMTNGHLLLHEAYRKCDDVAKSLIEANDILSRNNENLQFITAFVCVIDITTGIVNYVNAGHEHPLIRKADGSIIEIDTESGVPLGIKEGYQYTGGSITLDEGDSIFMYTDGVVDCVNSEGEHYSYEMMVKALRNVKTDIIYELLDIIEEYSSGAAQFDDITMMSFKLKKRKN